MLLRDDTKYTILVDPVGQIPQNHPLLVGTEAWRTLDIEQEDHSGVDFVDILSTRSSATRGCECQFFLTNRSVDADFDHMMATLYRVLSIVPLDPSILQ